MNNLLFSLAANGKSTVEEMWDYFVENYLSGSGDYPNLGLTENSIISLPVILAGLVIGAFLAVIVAGYDNKITGGFVREMLYKGAVGKENALTLIDMELGARSPISRALRKSTALRRIVRCVEEEDYYAELKRQREEHEKKREEAKRKDCPPPRREECPEDRPPQPPPERGLLSRLLPFDIKGDDLLLLGIALLLLGDGCEDEYLPLILLFLLIIH